MYKSREDAAKELTPRVRDALGGREAVIAGVPAGGAVIGARVAIDLDLAFACAGVYKVPVATLPNTTLAVIDADGRVTLDPRSELTRYEVQKEGATVLARMHRDLERCRSGAEEPDFKDATVVVIDDAVLSTLVVQAAASYLRRMGALRVVLATPVISTRARAEAERDFDEIIALHDVRNTDDLARFYADYRTPDEEEMQSTVHVAYTRRVNV